MAPIIRSLVSEAVAERDREISELRRELREVRTEMNALEQYSRRSCLNISGVPEARDESTDNIVRDVAAAAGVTLGPTDIDCSHRLGRQQDGKSRTIIVKLTSQNTRDKLYEARKHRPESRPPQRHIHLGESDQEEPACHVHRPSAQAARQASLGMDR